MIQKYCALDPDSLNILRETSEKYGYSARVIHKLLRLARTSADLDGEEKIRQKDIEKVLICRELDKSNSKMVVVKRFIGYGLHSFRLLDPSQPDI